MKQLEYLQKVIRRNFKKKDSLKETLGSSEAILLRTQEQIGRMKIEVKASVEKHGGWIEMETQIKNMELEMMKNGNELLKAKKIIEECRRELSEQNKHIEDEEIPRKIADAMKELKCAEEKVARLKNVIARCQSQINELHEDVREYKAKQFVPHIPGIFYFYFFSLLLLITLLFLFMY